MGDTKMKTILFLLLSLLTQTVHAQTDKQIDNINLIALQLVGTTFLSYTNTITVHNKTLDGTTTSVTGALTLNQSGTALSVTTNTSLNTLNGITVPNSGSIYATDSNSITLTNKTISGGSNT